MTDLLDIKKSAKEIDIIGMRKWLIREFTISFCEARKNKLHTFNEHAYDVNWSENIVHLVDAVLERYYRPSSSISFVIFEPMIREIFAAPFTDRIIHHFLYRMQYVWWDNRFIPDSYSCRENKGTLYAIKRAKRMMQQATNNFTAEAYIIKLDIRGYFMSLPRSKLYARIKWGLEHQFGPYFNQSSAFELYKICLFLWHQIIFDDPVKKSRRRGRIRDWNCLPPEKSLYARAPGIGIVIGNLTSQLVSNIFLDQLDRFIRYDLGYKYYGRYVDDFFIIVPAAKYDQAKSDVAKIESFLHDELGLTLHSKKRYYGSVYNGMSFLGARIYPHCLYPSNRLQKHFERAIHLLKYNRTSDETIISYFGFFVHLDADNYIKKVFSKHHIGYDLYLETKKPNHRPWEDVIYDMKCDLHNHPRLKIPSKKGTS